MNIFCAAGKSFVQASLKREIQDPPYVQPFEQGKH